MADYTVVVADIEIKSLASRVFVVEFGEAATQGETVYLKAADQKYYRADANVDAATAAVKGVLLTKVSAAGGFGVVITSGEVDLGGTFAVGETYAQSANVGKIAPATDLTTGDWLTRLGDAKAADNLVLDIVPTGIQHA